MNRLSLTALAVLAMGCSEYNISNPAAGFGEMNAQPVESPQNTDRIVQVTTPMVDILWVIDNSGSMGQEQKNLRDNFPFFMDYFLGSGLDYHIGVVSTDMDKKSDSGKLESTNGLNFITPETQDPVKVFQTIADLGTRGSGDEQGLAATYAALELEREKANAGFYREEAAVHTIVISDEEDHTPKSMITIDELIDWYSGLKESDEDRTFSAVVNAPGCCGGFGDEAPGLRYLEVADAVGGVKFDILNKDWSELLDKLGVQASGLRSEFFLSQLPVVDSLVVSVKYEGIVQEFTRGEDYTYSATRNSISFDNYSPGPLAEVFITYTVLASVQDDGLE